jgi:hypothetical protein
LLSPYSVSTSLDEKSYQFETSSGALYFAYFSEFILTKADYGELNIFSFGFSRSGTGISVKSKYDPRIRLTVLFLINNFFKLNSKNSILYLCLNNDGKAKYRHRTFNQWFGDLDRKFIKHQIVSNDFYSSIILLKSNPLKEEIINAFKHTINIYWGI